MEEPVNHWWNEDGSVIWSENCYPQEVKDLLLDSEKEDENYIANLGQIEVSIFTMDFNDDI